MTADIKKMVSHCDVVVTSYMCTQQNEPLMTYEIPSYPWKMAQGPFHLHKERVRLPHYSRLL